jgi:2-polyprenyl-3-methyl-5-hydroxy-6-metoxy-1,4-benzoquinol methylase
MSDKLWSEVKDRMNDHSYMGEIDRDEYRVKVTAEVFTPTDLVIRMIRECGIDKFAPGKTVFDPACGDGQFLVASKWVKILFHDMTESDALNDIYGVDLMRDNVDLCKKRLGGGTILMGNSLDYTKRIKEQTDKEYQELLKLFSNTSTIESFMS